MDLNGEVNNLKNEIIKLTESNLEKVNVIERLET